MMNTTLQSTEPLVAENSVSKTTPKPKRRKGRLVEEFAREIKTTTYKARQALELLKYSPELLDEVAKGKASLKDAVKASRAVRGILPRDYEETTFEERVIRSFENWTQRWQPDAMPQVREIIHRITEAP